jgi:DNA-binding MarR family transcriptional regulator
MTSDAERGEILFAYLTEVMILAQLVTNAFERRLPGAMTMAQFGVLNHLSRLGHPQSPAEIARAMQVRKSTMTSTLGTLVRAGHIAIAPDDSDGRAKRVSLTEAGRQARAQAIHDIAPELGEIGAALPPGTLSRSLPDLRQLRRLMDERRN